MTFWFPNSFGRQFCVAVQRHFSDEGVLRRAPPLQASASQCPGVVAVVARCVGEYQPQPIKDVDRSLPTGAALGRAVGISPPRLSGKNLQKRLDKTNPLVLII